MPELQPVHFYDQPIEVVYDTPPALEKSPPCPDGFLWQEATYRVIEVLSEWSDFKRRGRYARNMRPAHAALAASRGSLNVGRFYFRVRASCSGEAEGRVFDLYFDRAMKSVDDRKGQWFLYRELA